MTTFTIIKLNIVLFKRLIILLTRSYIKNSKYTYSISIDLSKYIFIAKNR